MQSTSNIHSLYLQRLSLTFILPSYSKKIWNRLSIRSSWSNNHFKIFTLSQDSLQKTEKDIVIHRTLMHIVQYYEGIVLQQWTRIEFLNQRTISHKNHTSVRIHHWIKANLMSDLRIETS